MEAEGEGIRQGIKSVKEADGYRFVPIFRTRLVRDGLATLQPGTVRSGTRRITVVLKTITDIGCGALAVE